MSANRWYYWTCRCGAEQAMLTATNLVLRESSHGFFCVHGHESHYPQGPSPEDKLRLERDRLKQENARLEDMRRASERATVAALEHANHQRRRVAAAKGQITRLKGRAANGLCPCCNRSFANLHRHMQTKHAGFVAEEVLPEGASVQ